MEIQRCASSQVMTKLLAWRNPQGSEEGWFVPGRRQGIENRWIHAGKCFATEIALCLLVITSTIETVVYSVFTLLSEIILKFNGNEERYKFFAKLLQSSSFTILWALGDAVFYNPFFINVMTHESFARYWADMFNPTPIDLFRIEDRLYVTAWRGQHAGDVDINDGLLGPILQVGQDTQLKINQGAEFIQQEVLANASEETLALFKEMDTSLVPFILTKAVYIYTFGARKNDEVPTFFKDATRDQIGTLRAESKDEKALQELERLLSNPTEFETQLQSESAKSTFDKLRNIASGELSKSLFITGCWQKAAEQLPEEQKAAE